MVDASNHSPALRKADLEDIDELVLPEHLESRLHFLIAERDAAKRLRRHRMKPTKGVLLHGPPGTGKSTTGMWLAAKLGVECYLLQVGKTVSHWYGQTEQHLQDAFDAAAAAAPCVLVLDECDSMFRRRSGRDTGGGATDDRITNTALQSIDVMPADVLLVATTNLLDGVDPAILRRFDLLLEIGLPDESCRRRFADNVLSRHGLHEHEEADEVRAMLVEAGEGHTLADASRWLRTAIRYSLVLQTPLAAEFEAAARADIRERRGIDHDVQRHPGERNLAQMLAVAAATEPGA